MTTERSPNPLLSRTVMDRDGSIAARGEALFLERFDANLRRVDRLFAMLMLIQWVLAIAMALFFSPYGWSGETRVIHVHVYLAVFLGGAISSLPILLALLRPARLSTR